MTGLRYSDRKRLAESGTLGPLEYDAVPAPLRAAIASIYRTAARNHPAGAHFDHQVVAAAEQHFGRRFYGVNTSGGTIVGFIETSSTSVDHLLDLVEILAEAAVVPWQFNIGGVAQTHYADAAVEDHFNAAFVRCRFGYRLERGEIRRIGSPALDERVVGPALLALGRPGWEEADRSFRNALHHRRGGVEERDAAITDAHAALEAAMKAAGLRGDRLSALAKSFRSAELVPPQLQGVPDALDTLLKRSSAIRDPLSDAHGKPPGSEPVPEGIVDLMIHWVGAFIVYLSEATHEQG